VGLQPLPRFVHIVELVSRLTTLSLFDSFNIHERKCSSEWSTKLIKRSGGTTEVAVVMDYALWDFFPIGVHKPIAFDIDITMTMREAKVSEN